MKTLIVLASLFAATNAYAQEAGTEPLLARGPRVSSATADEPDTLVDGSGNFRHIKGYGAPVFGITSIDGGVAPTFGVRGAFRLDRRFGIGLAGTGLETLKDGDRSRIGAGYGGILFEYVMNSNSFAHAVIDTTVGGGAWCPESENEDDEDHRYRDCDDPKSFFALEPTVNLELNVTHFMRFAFGGGYRLALASERDGIGTEELSGFVGHAAIQFGRF
jgi:hypothetical protein